MPIHQTNQGTTLRPALPLTTADAILATMPTDLDHMPDQKLRVLSKSEQLELRDELLARFNPKTGNSPMLDILNRPEMWDKVAIVENQIASGEGDTRNLKTTGLYHVLSETAGNITSLTAVWFRNQMPHEGIDWDSNAVYELMFDEINTMLMRLAYRCQTEKRPIWDHGNNERECADFVNTGLARALSPLFGENVLLIWE